MEKTIPIRAYVIDDDESVCKRLHDWLLEERFQVLTFTNPGAAVEHAAQTPCELALVDLRMPEVDGVDVIASLCRAAPTVRVIAMTAFPEPEQVDRAMRYGARDLLEKPIERQALLQRMNRQLAEIGVPERLERQFNRRLGARLRALRTESNRSQQDLALMANITAAQLSQIERGKTATTTWTLARLCGALRVPLDTFFARL